jgi:hypothetical protein
LSGFLERIIGAKVVARKIPVVAFFTLLQALLILV